MTPNHSNKTLLALLFFVCVILSSSIVRATSLYDAASAKELKGLERKIRVGVVVGEAERAKQRSDLHKRQIIPLPTLGPAPSPSVAPSPSAVPSASAPPASATPSPSAAPSPSATAAAPTSSAPTTSAANPTASQGPLPSTSSTRSTASPTASSSNLPSTNTEKQNEGNLLSSTGAKIGMGVAGGMLALAVIGIYTFRKLNLRPSNSFKARMMRDEYGGSSSAPAVAPPAARASHVSAGRLSPTLSGRQTPSDQRHFWMELNETSPPHPHSHPAVAYDYDPQLHRADTSTTGYSGYAGGQPGYDAGYGYYGAGAPPAPGSQVGYGYSDPYAQPVPAAGYGDPYGGGHAYPPPAPSTVGNGGVARY
ncbi:hypothetical protein HK097_008136 [Rhizophlyctis rosea]|uniref:Uncharacterized protein n=1 Tax=Rhizophlyctis rosea TaxID=64517 RepID=A0AAD5SJJ9_9FUNG|nr:hypothetical protein HK097_008136 [Rhizophlyctis rosea]